MIFDTVAWTLLKWLGSSVSLQGPGWDSYHESSPGGGTLKSNHFYKHIILLQLLLTIMYFLYSIYTTNTAKPLHLSFQWGTFRITWKPTNQVSARLPTSTNRNPTSQPRVSASSVSQRTESPCHIINGNQRRTKGCLGDHRWVKLHIPSIRTFSDPDKAV